MPKCRMCGGAMRETNTKTDSRGRVTQVTYVCIKGCPFKVIQNVDPDT